MIYPADETELPPATAAASQACEAEAPPAKRQATPSHTPPSTTATPTPASLTPPCASTSEGQQDREDSTPALAACIMCLGCVQTLVTSHLPTVITHTGTPTVKPPGVTADGTCGTPLLPSAAHPSPSPPAAISIPATVTDAPPAAATAAATGAAPAAAEASTGSAAAAAVPPPSAPGHVFDLTAVGSSHPADVVAHIRRQGLTFASLGMEVRPPAATVAREYQVYCRLRTRLSTAGGVLASWKYEHIVSMQTVIRKLLLPELCLLLRQPQAEYDTADLKLLVAFDHPEATSELVRMVQDQLKYKRGKELLQQHMRTSRAQATVAQAQAAVVAFDANTVKHTPSPYIQNPTAPSSALTPATATAADSPATATGTESPAADDSPAPAINGVPAAAAATSNGQTASVPVPLAAVVTAVASSSAAATATLVPAAVAVSAAVTPGSMPYEELVARSLTYDQVVNQMSGIPDHAFSKMYPWPPTHRASGCQASVQLGKASILLAGRYMKFKRNIPQTCWVDLATGKRIGGVSVAEHIESFVLPLYGARDSKFLSGGREDSDVRMLGEGRPFVMEIHNPVHGHPTAEALRRVEADMAASSCGAGVRCLTPCTKKAVDGIKEAEETKEKTYQALVWLERPVTEADITTLVSRGQMTVMQDTPVRVLHRRAPMVRSKAVTVQSCTVLPGRPHYALLVLRTQAGTYVKEWCHGDFGRTTPSLRDLLGAHAEILQLDVLQVHLDNSWP
ncbi:MAG: hypothetical protein WDW36_001562 [Sanguina aurantia]